MCVCVCRKSNGSGLVSEEGVHELILIMWIRDGRFMRKD